jgi:hypothetical protein
MSSESAHPSESALSRDLNDDPLALFREAIARKFEPDPPEGDAVVGDDT